jgi:hypothetical protein
MPPAEIEQVQLPTFYTIYMLYTAIKTSPLYTAIIFALFAFFLTTVASAKVVAAHISSPNTL